MRRILVLVVGLAAACGDSGSFSGEMGGFPGEGGAGGEGGA
jgi:hypothetical protein